MPQSNQTTSRLEDLLSKHLDGRKCWQARRHLLDSKDLTNAEIDCVMALTAEFKTFRSKHLPPLDVLTGKTIANVFYENSTRTRSSFELAAKSLGSTVLNFDVANSSVSKGETILDTARTLASMDIDCLVQRHSSSGSCHQLAQTLGDLLHFVNAGDGWNAHPTQALLDAFSMLEVLGSLKGAKIAIVGDITHSRVARSNIWLLQKLGAEVHVAGPTTLIPAGLDKLGVHVHYDLEPAVKNSDIIMTLRLQLERQKQGLLPSIGEYKKLYRIDHKCLSLAKPKVKVMHPGPLNRGIEITSDLADDPNLSLIETQVKNGVAVRMAVFYLLLSGN